MKIKLFNIILIIFALGSQAFAKGITEPKSTKSKLTMGKSLTLAFKRTSFTIMKVSAFDDSILKIKPHPMYTIGDFNNDGLVDLLTTVYYGCRYVDLYLQQKDHHFELSTYQSGLSKIATGNDACFVDYNNDGWHDLMLVGEFMPITFLKNQNGKIHHAAN